MKQILVTLFLVSLIGCSKGTQEVIQDPPAPLQNQTETPVENLKVEGTWGYERMSANGHFVGRKLYTLRADGTFEFQDMNSIVGTSPLKTYVRFIKGTYEIVGSEIRVRAIETTCGSPGDYTLSIESLSADLKSVVLPAISRFAFSKYDGNNLYIPADLTLDTGCNAAF
jgi:hypothetical protein